MADNKISLENILDEYSPDTEQTDAPHVERVDAQKVINSTLPDPVKETPAPKPTKVSHERRELFDEPAERQPSADEYKPETISRKRTGFAGSDGLEDVKTEAPVNSYAADDSAPTANGTPLIRRMADSTRAREVERQGRKKKRSRKNKTGYTYSKESPEGEYMYTPPEFKKKKRTRREILDEFESPEGKKYVTDIVPSPDAVEAAKPVVPAPRAEVTSLNLSETQEIDASQLDVHITQDAEEVSRMKAKAERTKRIVDFNYYGDVQDVGRDIYELKTIISTRTTVLAMTAFLSLYITLCSRFGFPIVSFLSINHIRTFLLAHLLLGLVAMFYSLPVITKGVKNLFTLKPDSDSLTAVTSLSCLIALLTAFLRQDMAREETIHIYMPVAILAMLMNSIGKLLIIRRAHRNFKFVSQSFDRHAVVYVRDEERAERLTRGTLGDFPILAAMRKTDFLTDFLRYSYSADITDAFCRKAVPLCLAFSAIVTVFLTFFRTGSLFTADSLAFGFSIFSMLICSSSCISLPFVANIPLDNISNTTLRNKGVLLGYQSVDDLYDANSLLVESSLLFPENTVRLGGIKVFSNTKIDEALLDAASLTHYSGSVLQQLFADVISGRETLLYPIENFSAEDTGLCGWINNRRILLGSRELMESHNIEGLPTKSQEGEVSKGHEPLYLSISGNLAALFVVDIVPDRNIRKWSEKLIKKKICLIVKSTDHFITQDSIASYYNIPKDMIRVIPKKLYEDFDAETKHVVRMSASMACTGRFSSFAQLILGIKIVHSSATLGLIFQTASILLGFALCMMLILSKAFEFDYMYMSATAMVIYNLIVTGLTYLAVNRKKL